MPRKHLLVARSGETSSGHNTGIDTKEMKGTNVVGTKNPRRTTSATISLGSSGVNHD